MTDRIRSEIERLLDEPDAAGAAAPSAAGRLRSRLRATVFEGLSEAQPDPSTLDASDTGAMAAFIDGQLTGVAREKFAGVLARQPGLRADAEAVAALVDEVSESSLDVPKHLL